MSAHFSTICTHTHIHSHTHTHTHTLTYTHTHTHFLLFVSSTRPVVTGCDAEFEVDPSQRTVCYQLTHDSRICHYATSQGMSHSLLAACTIIQHRPGGCCHYPHSCELSYNRFVLNLGYCTTSTSSQHAAADCLLQPFASSVLSTTQQSDTVKAPNWFMERGVERGPERGGGGVERGMQGEVAP